MKTNKISYPNTQMKTNSKLLIYGLLLLIGHFILQSHTRKPSQPEPDKQTQDIRQRVQMLYTSQIGIREQGSNSGPEVEKYLRYVKLSKGQAWCAAFVCWVYGKAGVENPKSGWSPDLFRSKQVIWQRHRGLKASNAGTTAKSSLPVTPSTADIFAIYFPEKGRIAHTGFVDHWYGSWLITVEGNTTDAGNRQNGEGVYRKRRLVSSVYMVARYVRSF